MFFVRWLPPGVLLQPAIDPHGQWLPLPTFAQRRVSTHDVRDRRRMHRSQFIQYLLLVFSNDLLRSGFANQISSSLGVSTNTLENPVSIEHDRHGFNALIIPHT